MITLVGRAERGAGVLPGLLPGELLQPLHPALVSVPSLLAPLHSRSQERGANNLLWIVYCVTFKFSFHPSLSFVSH